MGTKRDVTAGYRLAAACVFGMSSVAMAAPTYYADGTVWNNQASSWDTSGNAAYTAQYNMQPQRTTRSSRSSQAATVQPNTYTGASANTQLVASNNWGAQPNTYTAAAEQQPSQFNQWDSGYQAQSQTKKRGLLSRVFNKNENPATQSTTTDYSPAGLARGMASWYGSDFHGGKTANGERYDMYSMTAAHRTLPFGTLVKVTNESNGRECVVRINNRGPFLKGRILDCSKAAASELGFVSRGVAKIRMQVLGK